MMLGMLVLRAILPLLSLVSLACANDSAVSQPSGHADAVAVDDSGRDSTGSAPSQRPTPARVDPPDVAQPEAPALDPVAQAFLDAHNHHRASVSPAPKEPLPAMRWSDELAGHAKRVAEQCSFEHSKTDYGENLSARSGPGTPEEIVGDWVAEVEHYDARRNRCEPGEVCGHYTQVVWRASTELGCASARCTKNSPFGSGEWTMTVCNYAPAGNYSGQKPY